MLSFMGLSMPLFEPANSKVSVLDVLHMPPFGNGVWNGGEHHVEWVEVEQVPWCLHGCPLYHLHRLLRPH